jgi:hypothetical protein
LIESVSEDIQVSSIKVSEETTKEISYFHSTNSTCHFVVDVEVSGELLQLYIPQQINEIFVIEGRYRVPVINKIYDYECRMNGQHIVFDYYRFYDHSNKTITLKSEDSDEEQVYDVEDLDSIKEYLKLTNYQRKKFSIKLDMECPEYITKELIDACIAYGPDFQKGFITDRGKRSVQLVKSGDTMLRKIIRCL